MKQQLISNCIYIDVIPLIFYNCSLVVLNGAVAIDGIVFQ